MDYVSAELKWEEKEKNNHAAEHPALLSSTEEEFPLYH